QVNLAADRVDDEERRRGADPYGVAALLEQDAHVARRRERDVRRLVVVREDPPVAEAVTAVTLGSPLAPADAVAPAAPVEQEHRSGRRGCGQHEREQRCCDPDPHREGQRVASQVVRRLTLLAGAVVFFDTLFFAALTPLLPHYAHELGLGKTGAGVLSGAYPAGAFVGAVPSGIVAARAGAKRTVLVGLTIVAVCTVAFGLGDRAWLLDTARFLQGGASAFSWTGAFSWLLAATAVERRGAAIGSAFATAVAGALFGPVLGAIAGVAGVGVTFTTVGVLSLGLVAWASTMPSRRRSGSSSSPHSSSACSTCSRRSASRRSGSGRSRSARSSSARRGSSR